MTVPNFRTHSKVHVIPGLTRYPVDKDRHSHGTILTGFLFLREWQLLICMPIRNTYLDIITVYGVISTLK